MMRACLRRSGKDRASWLLLPCHHSLSRNTHPAQPLAASPSTGRRGGRCRPRPSQGPAHPWGTTSVAVPHHATRRRRCHHTRGLQPRLQQGKKPFAGRKPKHISGDNSRSTSADERAEQLNVIRKPAPYICQSRFPGPAKHATSPQIFNASINHGALFGR